MLSFRKWLEEIGDLTNDTNATAQFGLAGVKSNYVTGDSSPRFQQFRPR